MIVSMIFEDMEPFIEPGRVGEYLVRVRKNDARVRELLKKLRHPGITREI
ncbi:MAG TPA: hypothetical protein VEI26_05025 [Terriglobales bacterium]|nr:hypothetical protein [Terriglobales bacterium]